ncbi:hypothetical protein [Salegentibacter agarivorans]|nr:hypothetical protein [Salegentibacter agarivorans]
MMKNLTYIRVGINYYTMVVTPIISWNINEVPILYNILSGIEGFKALGYEEI